MSDRDCANDCTTPLRFPRRPGTDPVAEHGADCPCCGPRRGRVSADNRPALSRFNYRLGSYGAIREFLFAAIDRAPALRAWTHRGPDDPAVALLEGAATLGDILTFYQDTYANEAFLRTARWRDSVADLVRLLGYRLSPAVGGRGIFAFEFRKRDAVTIPAGFPLKATLEGQAKPAEFETTEAVTAYPWLNRFNLYRPLEDRDITPATTEFYISVPEQLLAPIPIAPGERLLIGDSAAAWPGQPLELTNAEVVIVDSVRDLHGTRIVRIKGSLSRGSDVSLLTAYRIGRTFHHLGHNGPLQIVDPSGEVTSTASVATGSRTTETETASSLPYLDVPSSRPIKRSSGYFDDLAISRAIGIDRFPLDLELTDLLPHSPVAIQARFAHPFGGDAAQMFDPPPPLRTLVRTITDVATTTLTWGAVNGTVSEITVAGPIHDSIGDGDAVSRALAEGALAAALQEVTDAEDALAAARQDAAARRLTADQLAALSDQAAADLLTAEARTATARTVAATMAMAAEVAAAALKDDATDLATQTALTAAIDALAKADEAKAKIATAASSALAAKNAVSNAQDQVEQATVAIGLLNGYLYTPLSPGNVHIWDLVLNGFIAGVDIETGQAYWAATAAETSTNSAKTNVDTAQTAVDQTREKVNTAKLRAEDAREAARVDARAKQRSLDADAALNVAKGAVTSAVTAESAARTAAAQAAGNAAAAEQDARAAVDAIRPALARLAAARAHAISKRIVSETRMYIKDALFHEVTSPLMVLRRAREETTALEGHTLNFMGTADEVSALQHRRVMLARPDTDPVVTTVASIPATVDAATAGYATLRSIDLSVAVRYADFPNTAPVTAVFGNLVNATEGKTVTEVAIGSGDAAQIFQTFKLPKPPLTYHLIAGNTPVETPEISVSVDGREWVQVESLFGRAADATVYIVREDAAGNSWVQFGDGKTGARPASGVNNITAIFRTGAGAFGALKAGTKVQAGAALENLDTITMPADVTGGAPPEAADSAREAAPGKVQSLGRLVSLSDVEWEAAAIPGVASAAASWQLVDGVPSVEVTVLMETGRADELQAVADTLNAFNLQRGAGRDPITVAGGTRLYVAVTVEYTLEPSYRADRVEPAIRAVLARLFSATDRRFGEREYASRIAGRVQNVEGVRWARTVALAPLTDHDDPAEIVVPSTLGLEPIVACDNRHMLSLFDGHLTLRAVMATEP